MYRIEYVVGKPKPGVDHQEQGWTPYTRREPTVDYSNLSSVIRFAVDLDAEWDGEYRHRVVDEETREVMF